MAFDYEQIEDELDDLFHWMENQISNEDLQFAGRDASNFFYASLMAARYVESHSGINAITPSAAPMSVLYDGFVTYNSSINTYVVAPGIATADLNTLINTAANNSIIQFQEGTYDLTQQLNVVRGNITLQGMGSDKTIFNALLSETTPAAFKSLLGQSIIEFESSFGASTTLSAAVQEGAFAIKVTDVSKFLVGMEIQVSQLNDAAFLQTPLPEGFADTHYVSDNVKQQYLADGTRYGLIADSYNTTATKYPLRTSLSEIVAIEGDTLYLKSPIGFNMDADVATVKIIYPLDNLVVSGFTLTNDLPPADPNSMTNTQNDWKLMDAVRFYYTRGSDVSDITIINTPSQGLTARSTYDSHFDNITIIGALNKDAGGNGYGLNIAGAQYNTFDNITVMDTRHGVLFSSWATEVGNIIHVTETNKDVNWHGSPDFNNVVIVDKDILRYTGFSIISAFGTAQPFTDIDANTTQFSYAVGGTKIDVLHATDFGSYLDGGAGTDYIYGGAGADVLIGNLGNDYITGGGGGDIFVMTNEAGANGGTDTIYDFNPAEDKLFFFDVNRTIAASWVKFSDRGADTAVSITGMNGNFLLKGVTLSQLTFDNVIINQKPYSSDAAEWASHSPDIVNDFALFPQQPTGLTIGGTDDADILAGEDTYDVITGGLGDDIITGGMGMDTAVFSGNLTDSIVYLDAQTNGLIVIGPDGFDRMTGIEMLRFADGDVLATSVLKGRWIEGTEAADTLTGRSRDDVLIGGAGDDKLFGDLGIDTAVFAGVRADNLIYLDQTGNVIVKGGEGFDRLYSIETLRFADGEFNPLGAYNGYWLEGTTDSDTLIGSERDDIFIAHGGYDYIAGNTGNDIAVFDSVTADYTVYANALGGLVVNSAYGLTTLSDVEMLRFQDGDVDYASSLPVQLWLTGTAEADTLAGNEGNDILIGKGGSDTMIGGGGFDTAVFSGNYGDYAVTLNSNGHYSVRSLADGSIADLSEIESLKFDNLTSAIADFAPQNFTATAAGGEVFSSGLVSDSVTGLLANFAGDTYNLGAGRDTLFITDRILDFAPANMPVMTGVDAIDISASPRIGNVTVNNAMIDQSDSDTLTLINGTSLLRNLSANITDPNLRLFVQGAGGAIRLSSATANTIYISDNNTSEITGGTNKDTIYTGKGRDVLTGGNGADSFIVTNLNTDGSADVIRDFSVTQKDAVNIAALIPLYTSTTQSITNFVQLVQDTANNKTHLLIDETGAGTNFHAVVTFDTLITQSVQDLIASKSLIVPIPSPPEPPPFDASTAFIATSAVNNFLSGAGADIVTGTLPNMASDSYDLGTGRDTLKLTDRTLDLLAAQMPVMHGIDVLDVSTVGKINSMQITDTMIAQSDNGVLTLAHGAALIRNLSANITDPNLHLVIEGTGAVRLASTGTNTVYASDLNKAEIIGGSSKDIFYGGHSQDIFTGGGGADLFKLVTNTDGKHDIIRDFSANQNDVLDISSLIESYDPNQHAIDNFVRMTQDADTGKTVLQVDASGSGADFHTAVSFDTGPSLDLNTLINKGNIIV